MLLKKMFIILRQKDIEDKILDITKLATIASLNAKINETKGEIPSSQQNLATTAALIAIEKKYLMLVTLSKKQILMQNYQKWGKKYFTFSDYNKSASNIFDTKTTKIKLVNQSVLNEKIKTLASKE